MAQAVPETKLELRGLPTQTKIGQYDPTNYLVPRMDADFIIARMSFRERALGVTTSTPRKEGDKLHLKIPAQQRSLIPKETYISLKCRATIETTDAQIDEAQKARLSSTIEFETIQNLFENLVIRDGRGTVLEDVRGYNIVNNVIQNTHLSPEYRNSVLQTEGYYDTHALVELTNGSPDATDPRQMFSPLRLKMLPKENIAPNDQPVQYEMQYQNLLPASVLANVTPGHTLVPFMGDSRFANTDTVNDHIGIEYRQVILQVPLKGRRWADGQILPDITQDITQIRAPIKYLAQAPNTSPILWFELTTPEVQGLYDEDDGSVLNNLNEQWIHTFAALAPGASPYGRNVQKDMFSNSGANFSFRPIASGLLNSNKHIPLWATNGLHLEFVLDTDKNFFTSRLGITAKIEIIEAHINYTVATYSPVVQAALEAKYIRDGINLIIPTYHINTRSSLNGGSISEEFQESFAMLDTLYTFVRRQDTLNSKYVHSFKFHSLPVQKYVVDYNRMKFPNWGSEEDLSDTDLYMEFRKGLHLLHSNIFQTISFDQWKTWGKQIMITNFSRYPEGNLSGVDTNTGRIKVNFKYTDNAESTPYQLIAMFQYQQLITMKDGTPTLIQS